MDNITSATNTISLNTTAGPSSSGMGGAMGYPGVVASNFSFEEHQALEQHQTKPSQPRDILEILPEKKSVLARYGVAGHQPPQQQLGEYPPQPQPQQSQPAIQPASIVGLPPSRLGSRGGTSERTFRKIRAAGYETPKKLI